MLRPAVFRTKRKIFLVLCWALESCSSPHIRDQLPDIDVSLVKPDVTAYSVPYPMKSPYVAKFEAHGRTLIYAAVKHASVQDYPNLFVDPTFQTIARLFRDYPVDAVVVEGIPGQGMWKEGNLPPALAAKSDLCEKKQYQKCGEPYFSIQEGRKKNAKIFRGEPLESEVVSEIQTEGFTAEDLLGFYIVRMIPNWKSSGEFTVEAAKDLIEKRIVFEKQQIGIHIAFDYTHFAKWYHEHMTKPASFIDIETSDTGETSPNENTYVQKISHAVGLVRDQSIASQIHKALNEVSTVLVVYGSSHYLNARFALEKMMGKPSISKLY